MADRSLVQRLKGAVGTVVRRDRRHNLIHGISRRLRGEPALPEGPIRSVLVLCHGNLFRSPFAAALLARTSASLSVASAGLRAAEDHTSPERAIRLAAAFGIDLHPHRTSPVHRASVANADLVLVMEGAHVAELLDVHPDARSKTRVLGDYLRDAPRDLPDPWREDDEVGKVIFGRVERAVTALVERIAEHDARIGRAGSGGAPE